MTPDEYCQHKAAQSGSSFYYAFLFLPSAQRRAITALYAYCREVDDVVDECQDPSVAQTKLTWWEKQIHQLYDSLDTEKPIATHPVLQALAPHILSYQIERRYLLDILQGMRMDLEQSRYLDFKQLEKYCYHVAGAVGILAARIFGQESPATAAYATQLGQALQLTNILRDVGEDARKGRIYLPIEDLQRFNVKAHDILSGQYNDNFRALMQFEYTRAQQAYVSALQALPNEARRAQRPGLIMAAVYHTLLQELADSDFQVLHQRISLTPIRKLWLAWSTWVWRWRHINFQ
ncbi:presqualene diphosphate synthase HpnD [Parvibium lacunae]|uniref:Squalene synthase HpnD n=1 Tax=Parvibium lacunae TaxID=1888893 RepID=A0A368L7Y8_9BURK|nr:presqualene diphosphate synthase HpnD [Parvibium lacunae]RCS59818.1 squalene synthase HpnD [Parvibium lacunae]